MSKRPLENVEATENGHDGCDKKIGNSESVLACVWRKAGQ